MTATTDTPTVQPEVPAWLNLDGLCSAEIRDALAHAARDLEAAIDEPLAHAVNHARAIIREFNAETACGDIDPDLGGVYQLLLDVTGFQRLWEACDKLERFAHAAKDDGPLEMVR